jgi:hypothetical protein
MRSLPLKPINITRAERERWLNDHVPYRIEMLNGIHFYKTHHGIDGPLKPVWPSIFESTLIACRWMTSFLGLYLSGTILRQIPDRHKPTDIHVVDVGGTLIDPAELSSSDCELLGLVFRGASVATAHPTREKIHTMTYKDVNPAAQILILKVKEHLYDVLRLPVPALKRDR